MVQNWIPHAQRADAAIRQQERLLLANRKSITKTVQRLKSSLKIKAAAGVRLGERRQNTSGR
jgi:hypothetical protein